MFVIDASVWVALFDARDVFHERVVHWFASQEEPPEAYRSPSIAIAEVGAALSRRTEAALAQRAVTALIGQRNVLLEPIGSGLAQRAAEIAIDRRIRGCDAVYVALAESVGLPLLTLDRQQRERAEGLVRVVAMEPGLKP